MEGGSGRVEVEDGRSKVEGKRSRVEFVGWKVKRAGRSLYGGRQKKQGGVCTVEGAV